VPCNADQDQICGLFMGRLNVHLSTLWCAFPGAFLTVCAGALLAVASAVPVGQGGREAGGEALVRPVVKPSAKPVVKPVVKPAVAACPSPLAVSAPSSSERAAAALYTHGAEAIGYGET